jgi:hypothetical protein
MSLRQHATHVVDHGIRVAIGSLFGVPVWLALWLAACSDDDFLCRAVAYPGLAFLGPAIGVVWFGNAVGYPASFPFDLLAWLIMIFSVPAFWGALSYGALCLYRRLRDQARRSRT